MGNKTASLVSLAVEFYQAGAHFNSQRSSEGGSGGYREGNKIGEYLVLSRRGFISYRANIDYVYDVINMEYR